MGAIVAGIIMLFACHAAARGCCVVPVAMALACEYPMRPLLDGATVRPLSAGLPPVLTCVVALLLWLGQRRLQVLELCPLSHQGVKQ